MALMKDHAVVLRLVDFSETSQVATVFTHDAGKVSILAKGIRRGTKTRIAPGLDLLEYGECVYLPARGDAQLGTLTEWRQLNSFLNLRGDLTRLYAGIYAAERTDGLTAEVDPHPTLFNRLLTLLEQLDHAAESTHALVTFLWGLLDEAGLRPNLCACAACGRDRPTGRGAYFSPRAPGLICRACAPRFPDRVLLRAAVLAEPTGAAHALAWLPVLDGYLTSVSERPSQSGAALMAALGAADGVAPPRRP